MQRCIKNSRRNVAAMIPVTIENMGENHDTATGKPFVLLQINTSGGQK